MVVLTKEIVETWDHHNVAQWLTSQNLGDYAARFLQIKVKGKELLEDIDESFCEGMEMMDSETDFLLHWIQRVKNGDGPEWDMEDAGGLGPITEGSVKGDPTKSSASPNQEAGGDSMVFLEDIESGKVRVGDLNLKQLITLMPHFNDKEVNEYKDNLDFNQFEFDFKKRRQMIVTSVLDVFNDQLISVLVAGYAMNLFDGEWFTSNRVFLYEVENNQLIGWFQQYLLLGQVYGDEILFHQYCPGKENVTLYCTLDKSHNELVGHYFSGKGLAEKRRQPIQMLRAETPHFYAFQAIEMGDMDRLSKLRKKFALDFDSQPDASGNTLLHHAIRYRQLDLIRYLIANGTDVTIRNTFGKSAYDVACDMEFESAKKLFPKDYLASQEQGGEVVDNEVIIMEVEETDEDTWASANSAPTTVTGAEKSQGGSDLPETPAPNATIEFDFEFDTAKVGILEEAARSSHETVRRTRRLVEETTELQRSHRASMAKQAQSKADEALRIAQRVIEDLNLALAGM